MEHHFSEKPEGVHSITKEQFNVLNINSISSKYKKERSESKAPTFALT
jgi:hypothetical protein